MLSIKEKNIGLLIFFMLISSYVFADYSVKIPLEKENGGSLTNGSILIKYLSNNNPSPEDSSVKCYFNGNDDGFTAIIEYTATINGNNIVQAGNSAAAYNSKVIGLDSLSKNTIMPAGITRGALQYINPDFGKFYEICGVNLESYPQIDTPEFEEL